MPIASTDSTTLDKLKGRQIKIVRFADIKIEAINWFWPKFLSERDVHVLAGLPGMGKTTIAMSMAAMVTSGVGPDKIIGEKRFVLIYSQKDDYQTLKAKILLMGGDPSLVFFIDRDIVNGIQNNSDPAKRFSMLSEYLQMGRERTGKKAGLVIFDSTFDAFISNTHSTKKARDNMGGLIEFADDNKIAVVKTMQFTKSSPNRPFYDRISGSIQISVMAGIVLVVDKIPSADTNVPDQRVLWVAKSKISESDIGIEFNLETVQIDFENNNEKTDISIAHLGNKRSGSLDDILARARHARARASLKRR
jgi:hypothetical protein